MAWALDRDVNRPNVRTKLQPKTQMKPDEHQRSGPNQADPEPSIPVGAPQRKSEQGQRKAADNYSDPKQDAPARTNKWWRDVTFARELNVFDALLFGVSVLGFGILAHQSFELRQTNKLAVESMQKSADMFRLDQRAWVTVRTAKMADRQIQIAYVNSGNTPALGLKAMGVSFVAAQLPSDPELNVGFIEEVFDRTESKTDPSASVLGPDVANTAIIPISPKIPSDALPRLVASEGLALYAAGYIEYHDAFGEPHLTTYCFVRIAGVQELASCSKWNSAN